MRRIAFREHASLHPEALIGLRGFLFCAQPGPVGESSPRGPFLFERPYEPETVATGGAGFAESDHVRAALGAGPPACHGVDCRKATWPNRMDSVGNEVEPS